MVVAYVTMQPSLAAGAGQRVYALLLPDAKGHWAELDVRPSAVDAAGFGLYPGAKGGVDWSDLADPVLLPYLGVETVCKDSRTMKLLLSVLKGEFERLTVADVAAAGGGRRYVANGLCAEPEAEAAGPGGGSSAPKPKPALPGSTELLQVAHAGVGQTAVCYLLAADVRNLLHLTGEKAHLFDLLCAHGSHEHADRHLATHVATVWRKEEGYVLINGHPGFTDPIALTAIVNEPYRNAGATLKMMQGYAKLLDDDDELLASRGLRQPSGARAAWRETVVPPEGVDASTNLSERMVLYASTRRTYEPQAELSVDYGRSYARNYPSGPHKPTPKLYAAPAEVVTPAARSRARWPSLPGWFNPRLQPARRPAFAVDKASGRVRVLADDPAVVRARRKALGADEPPATPAAPAKPAAPLLSRLFGAVKAAGAAPRSPTAKGDAGRPGTPVKMAKAGGAGGSSLRAQGTPRTPGRGGAQTPLAGKKREREPEDKALRSRQRPLFDAKRPRA